MSYYCEATENVMIACTVCFNIYRKDGEELTEDDHNAIKAEFADNELSKEFENTESGVLDADDDCKYSYVCFNVDIMDEYKDVDVSECEFDTTCDVADGETDYYDYRCDKISDSTAEEVVRHDTPRLLNLSEKFMETYDYDQTYMDAHEV